MYPGVRAPGFFPTGGRYGRLGSVGGVVDGRINRGELQMNLGRTFARGFVWKIAGLLALAAFGWFAGIGEANAQTVDDVECNKPLYTNSLQSSPVPLCSSRQVAYATVDGFHRSEWAPPAATITHACPTSTPAHCRYTATRGGSYAAYRWYAKASECPNGGVWNETLKKCDVPCDANAPPKGETWVMGYADGGSGNICEDGCGWGGDMENEIDRTKVDGIVYTKYSSMEPTGNSCTANDPNVGQGEDPPADGDGDGSSDGQDTSPGNPGQGAGGSDDPGGESDEPGEGSGNGNKSTGGGNCATPPNSHGDQIAAQTAYQTWATRCAIEKAQEKDGTLKTKQATGTGTGTGSGSGTGMGDCDDSLVGGAICAIKEFFTGTATEAGTLDTDQGEEVTAAEAWAEEGEGTLDLDASGYGWGSTCPTPPQISVPGGGSIDWGMLCEAAAALGTLILAAGYVQAAYIIGRG